MFIVSPNLPKQENVCCVLDCRRGQSLVVHAINEGRQAAREVDLYLTSHTTLPGPAGIVQYWH